MGGVGWGKSQSYLFLYFQNKSHVKKKTDNILVAINNLEGKMTSCPTKRFAVTFLGLLSIQHC